MRKIMMGGKPTADPKDEQWSVIRFLTLENVLARTGLFDHARYSSALAPSDFHAFSGLHEFLGGQRFHDEENLKKAVTNFFEKKDPMRYATGIDKLIDQREKFLTRYGNYVQK